MRLGKLLLHPNGVGLSNCKRTSGSGVGGQPVSVRDCKEGYAERHVALTDKGIRSEAVMTRISAACSPSLATLPNAALRPHGNNMEQFAVSSPRLET
jgi:hypothetical protein